MSGTAASRSLDALVRPTVMQLCTHNGKRNMGQLVGRCGEQNQTSHKLRAASDVTLHSPGANNLSEENALALLPNSTKPTKSHHLQTVS
jgi:hypothetical protein